MHLICLSKEKFRLKPVEVYLEYGKNSQTLENYFKIKYRKYLHSDKNIIIKNVCDYILFITSNSSCDFIIIYFQSINVKV